MQELIEELIDYIAKSGREGDVTKAKEAYFKTGGGIFGDEKSYDMRIGTFLEWYIFDRRMGGKSLLEEYLEKVEDPERLKGFQTLQNFIHGIYEVTYVYDDRIYLKDLQTGKKHIAFIAGGVNVFKNKNLLEVRLFPYNKHYALSRSFIFHPDQVKKYVVNKLKEGAARDDVGGVIIALANMSLKWEKYRKYKVEEIYKD